jgi:hypothetical protein
MNHASLGRGIEMASSSERAVRSVRRTWKRRWRRRRKGREDDWPEEVVNMPDEPSKR